MVKAAFTDFGFETAVASQQVFGGHGYIREWGMEQYVRDARIAQIYEGTNGVQAMDLVGRKLALEEGRLARRFFARIRTDLAAAQPAAGEALVVPVADALTRLEAATDRLLGAAACEAGAAATDYLRLFALVAFGWMWVRMAAAAAARRGGLAGRAAQGHRGPVLRGADAPRDEGARCGDRSRGAGADGARARRFLRRCERRKK